MLYCKTPKGIGKIKRGGKDWIGVYIGNDYYKFDIKVVSMKEDNNDLREKYNNDNKTVKK